MELLYKHNWLVHKKREQREAEILQAISGLTQQELCTICTDRMEKAREKSMVGRGRRKFKSSISEKGLTDMGFLGLMPMLK